MSKCVVDTNGFYIENADPNDLKDGQRIVETYPPTMRPYTGYPGFVKPKWEGKWVEGATFTELIEFEMTHEKGSSTEGKTIWQTLDESYTEGVNKAYDQ